MTSLPDAGYIALEDMCDKIKESVRQVSVPVMADGDTGYGSAMNVKRTVECYALAGAAGIMIEDQTWPKSRFNLVCNSHVVLTDKQDVVTPRVKQSSVVERLTLEYKPLSMQEIRDWTFSCSLGPTRSSSAGTRP